MRLKVVAIVPAAGSGRRLGKREKKPFVGLGGKPLVAYALSSLNSSELIDSIIVASGPSSMGRLAGIVKKYRINKVASVVPGGRTRAQSVRNCFDIIDGPCDIVLIHDGARPFLSKDIIAASIMAAARFGASIAAVRQTDTVKLAGRGSFIKKTLDRSVLWRAQTPQAFRYGLLKKAFERSGAGAHETDDASMIERLGKRVKIVEGSSRNIKITTAEDLKMAEALL